MERKALLECLETAAPALAATELIPVMSHFWFLGNTLVAYNDQIGISTPCKTDFVGAVPGRVLLSLLQLSRAKDVEMSVADDNLLVKAASARLKLGLLPEESFVFEMPKARSEDMLAVDVKKFLAGLESCMRSVSQDTSVPDQLGVTLMPETGALHLYSTNASTLSHAIITLRKPAPFKKRAVLSTPFCNQMLALSKGATQVQLEVHDDYALLTCGKTLLFGRLIETEHPLDFHGILQAHYSPAQRKQMVPIPSKLQLVLERAIVIAESKVDRTRTQVTARDGRIRFVTKSDRGEIVDSVQITGPQPDVAITLEPRLLKNGYGHFDKMLITEQCAIMAKDDLLYLISASV